ncbi:EF-hand domain-containing protein [Sphingobium sp. BYY-5]|uniref:EF-hand domain-containing protein n=1 Tax=Sphingobium sp. BYY-5 TaxID=2926400 RepID=UPI001FA7E5D1|nr:EF-hand domain-containing protein [Sphingobium sp. BYY-5]MCI4592558.1 EF-hand domain-containing protein [Sphingobium sp. BYY-5]
MMRDIGRAILLAVIFSTASDAEANTSDGSSLSALDRNGDGYLDRAEFRAAVRVRFDAIDSDRSGSITRGELRGYAFKHLIFKARDPILSLRHRPKNPPFDANGEMSFEAFVHMLEVQRFDVADTDHDGRVSREEARIEDG